MRLRIVWICCAICLALAFSQMNAATARARASDSPRGAKAAEQSAPAALCDGRHDFDFELGNWKIHLKKLDKPLTGSTKWIEFDGTSVTEKSGTDARKSSNSKRTAQRDISRA